MNYSYHVFEVRQTAIFRDWLDGLSDARAQARIASRLVRLEAGLLGDTKSVHDGVSEMRIDYGPGYRVYFTMRGRIVIVLLCGGDKQSQKRDIARAKEIAKNV